MKDYLIKHIEGIKYWKQHPELSATKVGEILHVDRHALTKNIDDYYSAAHIEIVGESYWCFTPNEWDAIQEYKNPQGKPIVAICKQFNIVPKTLVYWGDKLGIPHRGMRTKYTCNLNAIHELNEETAYWLGFLLADGYNNQDRGFLKVSLGAADYNHLVKLNKFFQSNAKVQQTQGGVGQLTWTLTINRRELSDYLAQYNIVQGKSGHERFAELIPEHLYPHYIRGLIDGDGFVTAGADTYVVGLVGSKELLNKVLQIFSTITPIDLTKHIYPHGTIWKLELRARQAVYDIFKYLYQNANVYLDRKYALAMQGMAVLKSRTKTGTVE